MSDDRGEERNAAATFDADGDGSPAAGGLGNLLGSYRSDDSGEQEAEAPESVRDDGDAATAATAATATATTSAAAAAPPPPPQPTAPQPAAPPPPPLSQAQEQEEDEQEQERRKKDPLWLPASLARKAGAEERDVDPALAAKVRRMLEASAAGRSLSRELRRSRAYRNPYFLEKMVDHLGLDPRASRLRAPRGYEGSKEGEGEGGKPRSSSFSIPREDTADALELEEAAERRAASSAATGRVEFVRGEAGGGGGGGGGARRGKRWD